MVLLLQKEFDINQLPTIAHDLLTLAADSRVFAFYGEMGAGKTTMVAALCHLLGAAEHASSPTFALINQYECPACSIFHMDWYRLKSSDEAVAAGVEDAIQSVLASSCDYCFIEWPERALSLLPQNLLRIELTHIALHWRKICVYRVPSPTNILTV
jgi:tRNA threonylcarbamoyladenosine biosynthesis protein TsaE